MTDATTPSQGTSQLGANIAAGIAVAQQLSPLLPPNVQAAIAIAAAASSIVNAWVTAASSTDITDEQLQGLFDQFAKNVADDAKAQQEAQAKLPI